MVMRGCKTGGFAVASMAAVLAAVLRLSKRFEDKVPRARVSWVYIQEMLSSFLCSSTLSHSKAAESWRGMEMKLNPV
jgi:hypothetical protein